MPHIVGTNKNLSCGALYHLLNGTKHIPGGTKCDASYSKYKKQLPHHPPHFTDKGVGSGWFPWRRHNRHVKGARDTLNKFWRRPQGGLYFQNGHIHTKTIANTSKMTIFGRNHTFLSFWWIWTRGPWFCGDHLAAAGRGLCRYVSMQCKGYKH